MIHTGGVRIDTFNATWPFAKLKATEIKIELKVFSKTYIINKDDIISLKKYKGLFSRGLKIQHKVGDIPSHVVFWTFSFKKLKKDLENLGYSMIA